MEQFTSKHVFYAAEINVEDSLTDRLRHELYYLCRNMTQYMFIFCFKMEKNLYYPIGKTCRIAINQNHNTNTTEDYSPIGMKVY